MPQSLTWYDTEIEHLLARDICDALNDLEALIFLSHQPTASIYNGKHHSKWLNQQLSQANFQADISGMIAAHEHLLHRLKEIKQHASHFSNGGDDGK